MEKEFYDRSVDLKAFGQPWDARGEYAWSVVSGTCTLSSKAGNRILVSRPSPGTVRLRVTYSIGERVSEPAFHTIRFVAYPVYVVGGGAAGLKAAQHLLSLGYKVVPARPPTSSAGAPGRWTRWAARSRSTSAASGSTRTSGGGSTGSAGSRTRGFRIDDQRPQWPQADGAWPHGGRGPPSSAAQSLVEESEEADGQAASTHVLPTPSSWTIPWRR